MDIRHDIALSPVYHYGMYSEIITPKTKYTVPVIKVNGNVLRTQDFTPAQWDKISYTVELFHNQQKWNSLQWNTDIKRLLHLQDSSKYINKISNTDFNVWYKGYLENVLQKKIDSVSVEFVDYTFNGSTFTKIPG